MTDKEIKELSDKFKESHFELYDKSQDEYIENIVETMLNLGIVEEVDINSFVDSITDNDDDLQAMYDLVYEKYRNYGHKKQTFIDYALKYADMAGGALAEYDKALESENYNYKLDMSHDSLVKQGEYRNEVDRIKPLLKIDYEDTNDLIKVEFKTENIKDYNYRLSMVNNEPETNIITINFPEGSKYNYYGYSWYFDIKLIKQNKDYKYDGSVYIELPKKSGIAIFEGESIKYISSAELKEEMA